MGMILKRGGVKMECEQPPPAFVKATGGPFRGLLLSDGGTLKPIFHCDVKTLVLGRRVGQFPQRESFALGIPTCWYLKMLRFVLPPTQTPNANLWNIGRVGSPTQNSCVGHVDFMLFVHHFLRWL